LTARVLEPVRRSRKKLISPAQTRPFPNATAFHPKGHIARTLAASARALFNVSPAAANRRRLWPKIVLCDF
jgi:hypothetical protein